MIGHLSHVMTLANSIIGVSVLAMPFCFKQCGIVLATLVLLVSSVLSRLACHFLIKSAVMSRRRNFEFLAFHAFGRTGKFLVELFIIGFLVGTCIAFFVVVGDLGPQIVGKMLKKKPEDIRTSLLVTTGTFIVLPLGLLRNIDSLSSVCTATIGFYLCLVVKVIAESARHIFLGDWYDHVAYWRPAGILQCLPIFAMALFCQTQLFEIYDAIPNVCLEKMNRVVRGALNICTIVYLCVGFFGYVAFCTQPFTGNILLSFEPSLTSELIKMGFVFSVAFSFPLVIFPCRASLNSLLFRRAHTHEPSNYYIPEMRFRCLTLTIVAMSLGTGILMPNIEFVLGIVGSTIGVMICLIFPAAFFIAISTKNTNERLIAQAILFVGMWIMVLGTYANLYAMEESSSAARLLATTGKPLYRVIDRDNVQGLNEISVEEGLPFIRLLPKDVDIVQEKQSKELPPQQQQQQQQQQQEVHKASKDSKKQDETIDVRREPPIPVERSIIITERPAIDASSRPTIDENIGGEVKQLESNVKKKKKKNSSELAVDQVDKEVIDAAAMKVVHPLEDETVRKSDDETRQERADEQRNENLIDSEAIKKEESELAAAGDLAEIESDAARHEKLRRTLEKHKLEQLEMMQEQKEILKDIKEEKKDWEMEKKRLAREQRKKLLKSSNDNNIVEESSVVPSSNAAVVDQANRPLAVDQNEREEKLKEKSVSVNDTIIRESPNSINLDNLGVLPIVESNKSRGPILNALTNWTSKRNATSNGKPSLINEREARESDRQVIDTVKKKSPMEYALPIALQMQNQTKENSERRWRNNPVSGDPDAAEPAAKRADREKREAIENPSDVVLNDKRALASESREDFQRDRSDSVVEVDRDRAQCQQKDGKSESFISRDATSGKTREKTTGVVSSSNIPVKTTAYLAEQPFVDKVPSLDPSNVNDGQADLSKSNKRDLKALNQEQ